MRIKFRTVNLKSLGLLIRTLKDDLETSEVAYKMAREAYVSDGRQVLDATVGGKLTVFQKADYDSLF